VLRHYEAAFTLPPRTKGSIAMAIVAWFDDDSRAGVLELGALRKFATQFGASGTTVTALEFVCGSDETTSKFELHCMPAFKALVY